MKVSIIIEPKENQESWRKAVEDGDWSWCMELIDDSMKEIQDIKIIEGEQ